MVLHELRKAPWAVAEVDELVGVQLLVVLEL
jgi:hypothetical protein